MKRFLARTVVFSLLGLVFAPAISRADAPTEPLDAAGLSARIDELIAAKYAEKGIKPAPAASDAEYIRRLSVDLDGHTPAITTVRDFLDDRRADKRRIWINILMGETSYKKEELANAYQRHMATYWRHLIFSRASNQQFAFIGNGTDPWFRRQIKDNVPYDQLARELITGQQGRIFFQSNENKPEVIAASTSRLFLGVRLECAQCHNDRSGGNWTRQQFWEYAAFFANTQGNRGAPQIKIPDKDQTVQAKFLDGTDPKWKAGVGPEVTLADWMVSPKNPYFARAAVNRMWAYFMGTGIIDPVDAASEANLPSHPELLDELTEQFILHKFDMKYLIRAITGSKTYQLTSLQTDPTQSDPHMFARASVRAMSPEQLFDSLVESLGPKDLPQSEQPGRRVFPGMVDQGVRAEFLSKFANNHDKPTETQTSILQALYLMNNEALGKLLTNGITLDTITQNEAGGSERNIRELYEAALSREPTPKEMERCVKYLETGGAGKNRRQALADILWALVVSAEFVSNH
jgi:hypothetical protein